MNTLTSIGIIDTKKESNVQFALVALDYQLSVSVELNYDLFTCECEEFSMDVHKDVNKLINEIMWLKTLQCNRRKSNNENTDSCILRELT